jgi:hypothetical protein
MAFMRSREEQVFGSVSSYIGRAGVKQTTRCNYLPIVYQNKLLWHGLWTLKTMEFDEEI